MGAFILIGKALAIINQPPGHRTAAWGELAKTRCTCTTFLTICSLSALQNNNTTQCKLGFKRVNNVHMVCAPEGTIRVSLCYCEQAKWRHDVTNEPCKTVQWIMKHNTAFCNRKNRRWNHQQAREQKSERKQALIKWSKAGRASLCVTARHTHLPTSES